MSALGSQFDLALCDLDGVAFHGQNPIPSAVTGIAAAREAGLPFVFVTNNASRTPGQVADHLSGLGVPTPPEQIMTSAMAAAYLCAKRYERGTLVLVVGGDGLREALTNEDMRLTESAADRPDVVVQGLAKDVGWAQLSEAVLAINAGAEHIATNLDSTLPTERGFEIGNGSLVAAVVNATGITPTSTGKPEPEIFLATAAKHGASAPVVIGDRLNTDIAGGVAAKLPTVHVLTGVSDARDVVLAAPHERPTYQLLDLTELTEPYEAAEVAADGRATCGDASAKVTGGRLTVGDDQVLADGVAVDRYTYRALVAAAWHAADAGESIEAPIFTVTS
ncbi:hypothetical protein BSZ39_02255 [Bowdeniella nasicola]|uniref:Haloacid Dehalogenase Superfamily Class (Subfamily) IIA n=1 Tax=Bowdeniella nasicola TaxID=208480 RepID=A0A1Q5Q5C0_9ACTO|nr:HAD-IIA family hydrolase [Bowdeniella nasicola]OKL54820.1 hypothetical protein BSZ39_02255 [Bowdeniella nasicola]